MSGALSAAKAVLLAVKLAAEADIESLTALAAQHRGTLRKGSLILRILLTYLPETTRSRDYVPLVRRITSGELGDETGGRSVDITAVQALSDDDAAKKVRRLHLLPLAWPGAPVAREEDEDDEEEPLDDLTLFLVHRAHRVDEEAGLLSQVPELVLPFLNRTTSRDGDEDRPPEAADFLRTWTVSVLLPLLRRNVEYYPSDPVPHTLRAFEQLPDAVAITALLSRTGAAEEDLAFIGRDLKGMIGPWLYNPARWRDGQGRNGSDTADGKDYDADDTKDGSSDEHGPVCPGFERVLEWLTSQASGARTWRIAVRAIEQCDSPADADIDLGGYLSDDEAAPTVSHSPAYLGEAAREYVERRWARAALAAAYLVPEASVEALTGAHAIVARISGLLDDDGGDHTSSTLPVAASLLAPVLLPDLSSAGGDGALISARNATSMRTGLLLETNPLTTPRADAVRLAHALVLSAFLLTRAGCPCTVRRAAELVFLQPEREQREEAAKLLHAVAARGGAKGAGDDKYWLRVRNEILWLRDWGAEEADESAGSSPRSCNGVFGQIPREFLEVEMLKAMLNAKRMPLSSSLTRVGSRLTLSRLCSGSLALRRRIPPAFADEDAAGYRLRLCHECLRQCVQRQPHAGRCPPVR